MNDNGYSYILVTPAKNEEEYLPKLIRSVTSQKIPPAAWFIIDDCSDDKTCQILLDAVSQFSWIHGITLDSKGSYDIEEHYSSICIIGFDNAIRFCDKNGIKYDFIALSDADMAYAPDYFSNLMDFLNKHVEYGIISGKVMIKDENGNVHGESKVLPGADHPMGTGRMWKRSCFEDTGGYILTKSPDVVSNVMALIKGWKVLQLNDVECYQLRDTGRKINFWDGYISKGRRAYYIGTNPLSVFNNVIDWMFISRQNKSLTKSIAYNYGYWRSLLLREKRLDNHEVREYIGSYRRILSAYKVFLTSFISTIAK